MLRRSCLLAGVLLAGLLPASAHAAGFSPVLGVSDAIPATLDDPAFQKLGTPALRIVVAWDFAIRPKAPGRKRFVDAVEAAVGEGKEINLTFNLADYDRPGKRSTPSRKDYDRAVRAVLRRWPTIRIVTPWNEANHDLQPTASQPELAAWMTDLWKRRCRRCTIVAADLLNDPGWERWLRRYRAALTTKPTLWGFHNYTDGNRFRSWRSSFTRAFIRAVPGKVWSTETGGIYRFATQRGRVIYGASPERQKRAMEHLLKLACHPAAADLRRLYVFQWRAEEGARWDSAPLGFDGAERPVFGVLERYQRRGCPAVGAYRAR